MPTETGALPPAHLPRAGDTIAEKYVVEEVLGAGGMGFVVAARHLALGTRVALKFLRGATVTDELRARFQREAQAAASIRNDHVARVLDTGILAGDTPYMVMDLLEGRDLGAELASRGRLPLEEAADCVIQACDGLAEAHARGIVHRDIKPSNLFLCRLPGGGTVLKVLDFGISKAPSAEGDEPTLTHTATFLGSPSYMSPEQIRHAKGVDARTDVWSLGVVLHQLLTGVLPFRGEGTSSTLASVMVDEPPSVRAIAPEVPAIIDDLLARCLQKNPGFRLQSVRELAEELAPHASPKVRALVTRMAAVPLERASTHTPGAPAADATIPSTFAPGEPAADTQAASVIDEPARPPKRRARAAVVASLAVLAISGISIGVVVTRRGTPEAAHDAARSDPPSPAAPPTVADEHASVATSSTAATSAPVATVTAPSAIVASVTAKPKSAAPKWLAKPAKPPAIVVTAPPPVATATTPPASTLKTVLDGHK